MLGRMSPAKRIAARLRGIRGRRRAAQSPEHSPRGGVDACGRAARGVLGLVIVLAFAGSAARVRAESQVMLPMPSDLGNIAATTFDDEGRPVGVSSFEFDEEDSGVHRMRIEMSVEGGGLNRSEAMLAPVAAALTGSGERAARTGLRLVLERSQATRADGTSLDLLVIDHERGRASCYPADDEDLTRGKHLTLPEDERVVNVPMQLLFQPLVAGQVDDVHFQITLCRNGPVIHDMLAVRGPRKRREGRDVVEVRYGPDLGNTIAWFASRLLPSFSFWFDAKTGEYLAHRMPLHTRGPEILLVRQGLTPPDIGLD
jgi:hypothetical protein